MTILNSHNFLPQSTAAECTTATLWCAISNIATSNLLIRNSGGTVACQLLPCSCAWPCIGCQSVCFLSLLKFIFTTHINVEVYSEWKLHSSVGQHALNIKKHTPFKPCSLSLSRSFLSVYEAIISYHKDFLSRMKDAT